uniref:Uncharacterized protein n=1 Tax=Trichuris muris TaxID=70415 RepID=A0A5S6Q254_TRIMR
MTADLNKPLQEVSKIGSVWARKLLRRFGSIVARCTAPVEVIRTPWLKTKGRHIAHEAWESSGRKKNTRISSLAKVGVRPTRLALRVKYDLQTVYGLRKILEYGHYHPYLNETAC